MTAMKAFAVFATGGLIAVVGLFFPLMPGTAQVILLLVYVPLFFVELATLIGAFMTGRNEGLSMGRRRAIADMSIPERVAPFALLAMVAAESFIHVSWLPDEIPPFMLLLISSVGLGVILRIRTHRRALDAWGAEAASGR